ncbi:hypothetical protein ACHAWF_002719 [Thalassiosira exigua]
MKCFHHRCLLVLVPLANSCASYAFLHDASIHTRTVPKPLPLSLFSHQSAEDPVMNVQEPSSSSPAYSLYHTIAQNRACSTSQGPVAIPIAGVHDALSAKIFAQHGASVLFLSGFGVSASLLALPDAGMLNLVEMAMMASNVCSAVRHGVVAEGKCHPPPIIVDGDTGYGGASNMLRTISSLASAGAAAITIEDQQFPKKCTIAAGSKIQIVDRDEAVNRVKGALGARDFHNGRFQTTSQHGSTTSPWIVARTDCRMAYGFREVVERCLLFEELGAEIIYAENLQSRDEYERLRECLDSNTVTMVAQVQESMTSLDTKETCDKNAKPLLTIQDIGELGFDLALFGVTPLQCVVGTLESTARNFLGTSKRTGTGIIERDRKSEMGSPQIEMADFATVKRVVGFGELEGFETEFPCTGTNDII